jgi:hypothetical protein
VVSRWPGARARAGPSAACAGRTALFGAILWLTRVAGDHGDRGTLNLIGSRRSGLLAPKALASLTRPLLHVSFIASKFCGTLVVREIAPHTL